MGQVAGAVAGRSVQSLASLPRLSRAEVATLKENLARETNAFIDKLETATPAERKALLARPNITNTIDKFVQDVEARKIDLPGVDAVEVVAPAVEAFLRRGIGDGKKVTYSIDATGPGIIGGRQIKFSLDQSPNARPAGGIYFEQNLMR